jgi:aspartyl-tRNA(Asn)/glutamyl-tRNA(Gln) amidotransferase subunit C
MTLTLEQVRHVAHLARLGLTEDELEKMRAELTIILDYIDQLATADTSQVAATAQVGELVNVMRDDERRPSLDQGAALANAPARDEGFFVVKAMQE